MPIIKYIINRDNSLLCTEVFWDDCLYATLGNDEKERIYNIHATGQARDKRQHGPTLETESTTIYNDIGRSL